MKRQAMHQNNSLTVSAWLHTSHFNL